MTYLVQQGHTSKFFPNGSISYGSHSLKYHRDQMFKCPRLMEDVSFKPQQRKWLSSRCQVCIDRRITSLLCKGGFVAGGVDCGIWSSCVSSLLPHPMAYQSWSRYFFLQPAGQWCPRLGSMAADPTAGGICCWFFSQSSCVSAQHPHSFPAVF